MFLHSTLTIKLFTKVHVPTSYTLTQVHVPTSYTQKTTKVHFIPTKIERNSLF